jgi:hypothetical protein
MLTSGRAARRAQQVHEASGTPPFVGPHGESISGSIAEIAYHRLGGIEQWVLVRGENVANPPLILLHGGPGLNETALFRYFNAPLEKSFTVVHWDQRGAGKSFDPAIPRVNDEGEVVEIDPRTNAASNPISVGAESLTELAVGAGAVWVADPLGGIVWRIDPDPDRPLEHTISLEVGVGGVAFGEGAVWASNEIADEVYRIDPDTNEARVVSRMAAPRGIAVGESAVWVTSAGPPSAEEALPASSCDKLVYGGAGSPRFVVASDLPLQGPDRATTLPMTEAIRFVFEQRNFKAGPYTLGYQSCDDSTAQAGGYDPYKCFSNAKAYARNLALLGVVGPFNSGCADVQIPTTNQAPGGGLAMISPSTTLSGLTRPDPGELPGERNFVRIAAADHLQAVADAQLVKELGARRLFVLSDPYFRTDVETAARNLGLEIVGSSGWNSEARNFDRIARRIPLEANPGLDSTSWGSLVRAQYRPPPKAPLRRGFSMRSCQGGTRDPDRGKDLEERTRFYAGQNGSKAGEGHSGRCSPMRELGR